MSQDQGQQQVVQGLSVAVVERPGQYKKHPRVQELWWGKDRKPGVHAIASTLLALNGNNGAVDVGVHDFFPEKEGDGGGEYEALKAFPTVAIRITDNGTLFIDFFAKPKTEVNRRGDKPAHTTLVFLKSGDVKPPSSKEMREQGKDVEYTGAVAVTVGVLSGIKGPMGRKLVSIITELFPSAIPAPAAATEALKAEVEEAPKPAAAAAQQPTPPAPATAAPATAKKPRKAPEKFKVPEKPIQLIPPCRWCKGTYSDGYIRASEVSYNKYCNEKLPCPNCGKTQKVAAVRRKPTAAPAATTEAPAAKAQAS